MANHRQVQRDKGGQLLLGFKLGRVVLNKSLLVKKENSRLWQFFISSNQRAFTEAEASREEIFHLAGYVSFHKCSELSLHSFLTLI